MNEPVLVVCSHCNNTNRLPKNKLAAGGKCGVCHSALFDGAPFNLNSSNFQKHISKNQLPLVVDYWASWCGPCKMMAPMFANVARKLEPEIRFAKINTETEQSLAASASIRSIPTLVIYKDGAEVARTSGVMDENSLLSWIQKSV